MIRILLLGILIIGLYAKNKDEIIVAGPFASVSHPMIIMEKNDVLKDLNKKIKFKLWKNPDELRALVLNEEVDFMAIPTNVASNLYNKGVHLKLLNVSVWGILGMVSRDKDLKSLKDFKGKEIIMPFKSDMPDIIFSQIAKKQGLNLKKDFDIKYVSSPIDAMQMLITRRADHVLLAEPAISIALRKTKSFPMKIIAPSLYRSVDLQKEWGKTFKVEEKIPQAGIAFLGEKKDNEKVIKRFLLEYEKALKWYKQNPKIASRIIVEKLPMLDENGLADSIDKVKLQSILSSDAKQDLEFFFNILKDNNPKSIGGKLPNSDFYYENK